MVKNGGLMNKAILKKDIDFQIKDEFNKAADIDSSNYRVFLSNLDIERTIRIYKSVVKLSISSGCNIWAIKRV